MYEKHKSLNQTFPNENLEEAEYLKNYDIANFDRPSLCADLVIFTIDEQDTRVNSRKPFDIYLKLLLIKRGNHPFKGYWALPGGFCKRDEDVIETAKRELAEESGIQRANLSLSSIYGSLGRDPRGWIISSAFRALVNKKDSTPRAGSDAWEARWFSLKLEEVYEANKRSQNVAGGSDEKTRLYKLALQSESDGKGGSIELNSYISENSNPEHNRTLGLSIYDRGELSFDHALIIFDSLKKLKDELEYNPSIIFDLMPEKFTLSQLQTAFEIILNKKLLPANFRRKIADYVEKTDNMSEGDGFRPARLYMRKR